GQDQDAASTATLDATGSVTNSNADMVLQINTNYIQDNGVNSNFTTNGLILRIGTMNSMWGGGSFTSSTQEPTSAAGVGREDASDSSNGRSNVMVTGNVFEGNYGEDVFIESFVSTVDPNVTADVWTSPASNPNFRVLSSYQRDPLARLNLYFEENTGNGLDVTNFGAYYDTSEGTFKSRLNNYTAPVPDGPFTSATRRRNAQRIASRAGYNPTTEASPNGPPDTGNVIGASIDPASGRILIQSDDVSALANGYAIEITRSLRASQNFDASPIYGLFTVADIDYNANTFTLVSTEGFDLTGYSTTGVWSTNENTLSFVYDGVGVSTFRVNQTFFNNSFDSASSTFTTSVVLGNLTGENNFAWDFWSPDADTFLVPVVSTFLTADISVAVPDPTNDTNVGDFIISFTEDVANVDFTDFALFHDNVDISGLLTSLMFSQIDLRTFRLNIDSILGTEGDGEYELRLINDGTISDAKYLSPTSNPRNFLMFGDIERFTVDTSDPTVTIDNVSPDPRSAAVGELIINFSEDVTGVDLGDFTLVGPNGAVNLAATPATLTQVTGSQFVLDLSKVTSLSGTYTLTINTTVSSSIVDSAGNALTAAGSKASETWVNDTLAPIGTFQAVADGTVTSVDFDFDFLETVTGVDASDFELYRNGSLVSGGVLSVTGAGGSYTVNLDGTLTSQTGVYTLVFLSEESGVTDASGNAAASSPDAKWNNGTDFTAPTAGIEDVSPDGTSLDLDDILNDVIEIKVAINFSEPVSGVNDNDGVKYTNFVLNYDDGTTNQDYDVLVGTLTDGNGQVIGVTPLSSYLLDLSSVIDFYNSDADPNNDLGDGLYTLKLLGGTGTITDVAGNVFTSGATDTFRIGDPVLQASIQDIPPVVHTNVGNVSISFDDGITSVFTDGVTLDDFRLTLNGQALDLAAAGVTLTPVGTASTFTLDLSMITQVAGSYELTLIAAGSGITGGGNALLTDASVSWINSSTIDLTGIDPANVDRVDDVAGDGIVGDGSDATVTLRAAIQEANALVGSNTIELAAGTYLLGIAGIDEDQSATGDLDIRDNLTIRGQGVGVTIIDGGALDRIFQIFAGITLNLENLTITNGFLTGSDDGAGIRNSGTTTLTNVEVTDNHAEDSAGGINNSGLIVIVDSTISNNTAGGSGGALRNTGTMQISRSTISGNTTARDGGALFNAGAGTATISNTTFSGNSSDRSGGAIRNTATLTAINNTMTLNDAGTTGGAISNSGTATIQNNLVIGNTATTNPELDGAFSSLDGNLIGLVGSATGFGFGDIIDVADPTPVLDLNLADNGGPTLTHALLLGSIAIDAGINANTDALEQRGSARILGSNVDIGAVEYGAFFVNSTLDTVDANPGDGIAADANGNLTLRAAIMEANALAGDSV
ncbi:MAG: right-handed parallel beta-helix repeat-containing protein, partial [Planctomycetaceae bacterium]|nr:right-handed parallel beta-helix repeat-containing protein [Planctomycetaceae bacterium]